MRGANGSRMEKRFTSWKTDFTLETLLPLSNVTLPTRENDLPMRENDLPTRENNLPTRLPRAFLRSKRPQIRPPRSFEAKNGDVLILLILKEWEVHIFGETFFDDFQRL